MGGGLDRKVGRSSLVQQVPDRGASSVPGKRTLTAQLLGGGPPGGAEAAPPREGARQPGAPSAGGGEGLTGVHAAAAAGVSGSGGALPYADQIQAAFGPAHDVSSIQAHVGGAAEAATARMGAEAYATGDQIAFGKPPSLHTAAHEAAHVMQQREGVQLLGGVGEAGDEHEQNADAVADRVVAGRSAADLLPRGAGGAGSPAVQMRRLPRNVGAMLADPTSPNYQANLAGTRRLLELAEAELTDEQRAQVNAAMLAGQTQQEFDALPEPTRLTRRVEAILAVVPNLELGDPNLIDTGPRPNTADAANLDSLVASANTIFDAIAAGTYDTDIDQVFGATNRATAKAKYANAKTWMNNLHAANKIVTDRSGYNAEVFLGGLTGFQRQIALAPGVIDSPANASSIITMIHESMHAGNDDVDDKGYIGTQVFTQLAEDVKLTNAAHYEVIPRRILNVEPTYAGQTFTPAGSSATSGGPTTAPLTATQTAVREASEHLRMAWTMGLNLHTQYDTLYKNQTEWDAPRLGGSFHLGLPYWSKVEKLTIHLKTVTDPTATDPALRPISDIDMAISEGVTRKFGLCMFEIGNVPNDDAGATTYLNRNATAAAIATAQASPDTHRDLWIRVVLRNVGSITGTEDRDLRVIHELFPMFSNFGTLLQQRDLGGFPD